MKIRYTGPAAAVRIPTVNVVAQRGEPIDVDTAVASSLLEQAIWQRVATSRTKKPKE